MNTRLGFVLLRQTCFIILGKGLAGYGRHVLYKRVFDALMDGQGHTITFLVKNCDKKCP